MKNTLLFIIIFLNSGFLLAQNFAPVGATWHYSYTSQGDTGFVKIESKRDTTILGKLCSAVQLKESCKYHGDKSISNQEDYEVYLHSNADSVFIYYPFLGSFQLLYAFNAQIGDSWFFLLGRTNDATVDTVLIEVESIYTEIINAKTLRGLGVKYTFKSFNGTQNPWVTNSKFTDVIGDFDYLFNFRGHSSQLVCDEIYPSGLRCYSDNTFGNYETGIVDSCTHYGVYVGIEELKSTDIKLWPNPVTNIIHIQSNFNETTEIRIFDITGSVLIIEKMEANNKDFELDLSRLNKGIYFFQLKLNNETVSKRIVKL